MSKMLKSSGAMAIATLTSRLLGMVREQAYMYFLDVGWVNDAFQFAFTIPNLFRRLLGEGALTAAFIPVFKEKEKLQGETEMWRAANAVISGLVLASTVVIAVALVGISLALGVHQFAPKTDLMLRLLRVMFPYMLLVCLAAAFMGMLNARGKFFIPAMGAAMLNVVMIASVFWLAPHMGVELHEQIFALAIGVLAAGVAQAAFQLPSLWRDGFRYQWVAPWGNETVRRVVVQMIPGTIGIAAFQINVAVVYVLGFWVGNGVISSFNGAVRLMEFPQGLFGISLATYLLPTLSGLAAEKNYAEFRATLRQGLATLTFLNLIASILLVVLAEPIVRLIFQHGRFTDASTLRVAFALKCLAPGLVMFSTVNVLARAFYALGDTRTPMKISIACLVLNLIFAALLVKPFQQGGLGLANTASAFVNMSLLTFALRKKLKTLEWAELRATFVPLVLAGLAAGILAWFGWHWWEARLGHATLALQIGAVFAPAAAAGLLYWLAAWAFKISAAREILAFVLLRQRAK